MFNSMLVCTFKYQVKSEINLTIKLQQFTTFFMFFAPNASIIAMIMRAAAAAPVDKM
jgi:hypothetical protein